MGHLSNYREKIGLSQRALADQAKISPSYLCEIEKGGKTPSLRTAHRIQEATNGEVTVSDLLAEMVGKSEHGNANAPRQDKGRNSSTAGGV